MKFFLVALFFMPLALSAQISAPDIPHVMPSREAALWKIEDLLEAYRKDIRSKGRDYFMEGTAGEIPVKLQPQTRYIESPDISHLDREAERIMAERAQAVRYVMEDTERIITKRAQAMDYIRENTETVKGVWPERDALEYISRAAKLQEHISGLISRSGGELCGLSQDPIQLL